LKEKLKIVSNGRGKSKVNKILFETIFPFIEIQLSTCF
jgi:hypothetical protein